MRKFKKRNFKKKRKGRSFLSKFASGASTALGIAGKALMVARGVRALLNVEFKRNDIVTSFNVGAHGTGTVSCLNLIAQGDTDITRNGDNVRAKSLSVKGRVFSEIATNCYIRILIIQDKDNRGEVPTWSDVMTTDDCWGFRNLDNTGRFKVLYDKVIMTSANTTLDGSNERRFKFNTKLDEVIKYTGTTAATGDLGNNALFIMFMPHEVYATYQGVEFDSRLRYIDN